MQNEKNVICLLFLVIVSVNAQLKADFYLMVNKSVSIIKWKLIQSAFDGSPNIKKQKYGVTNEGRDLNVYFIPS
jgi:hypothetical protein